MEQIRWRMIEPTFDYESRYLAVERRQAANDRQAFDKRKDGENDASEQLALLDVEQQGQTVNADDNGQDADCRSKAFVERERENGRNVSVEILRDI
jgi:hypothetical protein